MSQPNSQHFDVVVLGAGPGGYVGAIRAAQLGKSVAVVESRYWGGVCLNVGCIPSKALLRNAELAHLIKHDAEKVFGISVGGEVTADYGKAYERSRTVADGRVKGVHYLMKKNGIAEVEGWGTFTDARTLDVRGADGSTTTVTFDDCIIAAGATTKLLPGTELSERVVTYEEQILDSRLPGSVIIAGAGAIGVEFGYVLANYGVQVTIVEFLDRVVPLEDPEVSKELTKQFKKLGIEILTSTKVDSIDDTGDGVTVTVTKGDQQQTLHADKVLQAIGFAPRVDGYGLDKTGVELSERGAIAIDG
ncbi:MAG: dihydrolipoyl dehydrogenase family protein, partial [Nocardioidaceae bacterium]